MILVDTSVWIDHIRRPDESLRHLLEQSRVLTHPIVIGELAVGNLPDRARSLRHLGQLPAALTARHHEVLTMIERLKLYGRGIGYADTHLLASARLSRCLIWARDRRLTTIAEEMGIAFSPPAP